MAARYLDEKDDAFWSQSPSILFNRNRLIEFVPTSDMTWKERLNALTRLFVYAGLLLMMYLGKAWPMYFGLVGLLMTLFLFRFGPKDPVVYTEAPTSHPTTESDNPYIPPNQPACIPPTRNNPFGNVLQNEYIDNPLRAPACDYDTVKDEVENQWSYNLYQDVGEAIWNRNNSQRQFYTTPNTTIPNDQGAFANWLFKSPATCKEDQMACLRTEDVRANRGVVGDSEFLM